MSSKKCRYSQIWRSVKRKTQFWSRSEKGHKWNDFVLDAHHWAQMFSPSIAVVSLHSFPTKLQYPLHLSLYPYKMLTIGQGLKERRMKKTKRLTAWSQSCRAGAVEQRWRRSRAGDRCSRCPSRSDSCHRWAERCDCAIRPQLPTLCSQSSPHSLTALQNQSILLCNMFS